MLTIINFHTLRICIVLPPTPARVSALAGDSDDSDTPNTYDYTDSFIDDEEVASDCESTEL